jgi:hypothetical protein
MALLDFTGAPHGGRQRHLPEWQSQRRMTATTIIDHSIVGSGEAGFRHFAERSVLESHFIVCGVADERDGLIWQLMDTDRQADANLNANGYAISIETGDGGDPDRQPWTPAQQKSLIWLHNKLRLLHPGIPRRKSRSCADPAGLGYHTLHGAPSCWTPVAKTCPGTVRRAQWREVLLPAFLDPDQEEDMTIDELNKQLTTADTPIRKVLYEMAVRAVNSAIGDQDLGPINTAAVGRGSPARKGIGELVRAATADLSDDEANILAAIGGITPDGGLTPEQVEELKKALLAALPGYTVRIEPS